MSNSNSRIASWYEWISGRKPTTDRGALSSPGQVVRNEADFELAAEAITVQIRWFGLGMGYVLVNFIQRQTNQPILNGILTIGAVYALVDTLWSLRGRVFLSKWPLVISLMEAVFIGFLCYFDGGVESPFRFYYFLSLLVCAIRNTGVITYSTYALHSVSFAALTSSSEAYRVIDDRTQLLLMLVLMGWFTWASTSLADLLKAAGRRLSQLNDELRRNQLLLEERISQRTQELQESQALIVHQEKQAAFGLLAAGIAHEVGNPLAAISSLVQLLNRRDADDYTRERLQMVDDQLRRIQRTLRELVDFSRPATNQYSQCDVHEIVQAALDIAKYYKRKKGKRIVTRFSENLPKSRVVRDQLVQILLNLILNAMDATKEGGTIEITTSLESGRIRVSIIDDGHGISPTEQERIFQPYFTTKETGTGLGLFVCKSLIDQMPDAEIELTDVSAQGTTFSVFVSCDNVQRNPDVTEPVRIVTEEVHTS